MNKSDATRCTCGPYPIIDLTPAFDASNHNHTSISNQKQLTKLQSEVKAACEAFGCFHVTINTESIASVDNSATTPTTTARGTSSLCDLANEGNVIDSIESLFDDDFISSQVENIFENNCSVASVPFQSEDDRHLMAKYRGRSAESGSTSQHSNEKEPKVGGEPKQSWELFRCSQILQRERKDILTEEVSKLSRLKILQGYTDILHSVAEIIFSPLLLDLPHETFVSTSKCRCSHDDKTSHGTCMSSSSSTSKQHKETCCCIDLLRVFRYDSLYSADEQASNLGSSPHTDWGSLTVVWQDSIGGLQIYCHAHDRWNDVTTESQDYSCDNDNTDKVVQLFIHVGDFLSLALSGASKDGSKLNDRSIKYPSPMHRVVCPKYKVGNEDNEDTEVQGRGNNCRCSLVYFAYPLPGLSLQDAQSSVFHAEHLHTNVSNVIDMSQIHPSRNNFPFDRYMLLHDQSIHSSTLVEDQRHQEMLNKAAKDNRRAHNYYECIHSLPFDSVIREKWDQVQR